MGWRELVAQNMAVDIERRRNNPGVQALGQFIKNAMEMDQTKLKMAMQEEVAGRTAARTAVYGQYPKLAAKELGIDTTGAATTTTLPTNARVSKVTVDEKGQPVTVYETPEPVKEADYMKLYNDFVTEVKKTNETLRMVNPKVYKPTPIPTYDNWKKEMYGIGTTPSAQQPIDIDQISDDDVIKSAGFTEDDVAYTLQTRKDIKSRADIANLIRNVYKQQQGQ